MNSSGIKRGLATAAITALAVTGVPAIANATPISAVNGANTVDFYAPEDATPSISAKNDGTNTTVSLVVGGGVNVTSVIFQYSTVSAPATYIDIAAAVGRNADGAFALEWTAPPGDVASIRAVPNTGVANGDTQTVVNSGVGGNTVELASEGARGVFQEPYTESAGTQNLVSVSGTTSGATTSVDITDASHGTAGTVTVASTDADGTGAGTTGAFAGIVDIAGYTYSGGSEPNQIVFNAATDNTDDAEASTLYVQTIGSITATPDSQNRANPANAEITLTVLDTQGNPVAGAQVGRADLDTDGAGPDTDAADTILGTTNARGQITDTSTTTAETFTYFVNLTDTNEFEPAVDKADTATVTTYVPVNTKLVASSIAGVSDFDIDELADDNDFRATLTDQTGQPVAGQPVEYRYTFDPAGAAPAGAPSAYTSAGTTDADGRVTIPFDGTELQVGTYTIDVRRPNVGGTGLLNGTSFTFDTNESEITFDEAPTATSATNSTDTYTGRLALVDGQGGLGGRTVVVTYDNGGAPDDSSFSTTQPAGTTRDSATQVTAVTKADGTFSVSLTDPAVPANVASTADTGVLTAQAAAPIYDAVDDVAAAQDSTGQLNVTFAVSSAPAGSVATVIEDDTTTGTPGVLDEGSLELRTAGGAAVPNTLVTLTVDKGFFTDGTADPAPAVGADTNEYKSLGQSITVTTDANGDADFTHTIERDAGFDDDGAVAAVVTATVGTVTDTETFDYSSSNPLNGGAVQLVETPADEQSGPTDPASVDQTVLYDLYTTDQFGNRVGNEFVQITENASGAQANGGVSDFAADGDVFVYSDRAQTVTVTAAWTTETSKYVAPLPATAAGTETLTTTADVAFEGIDFANSTFTISSSPEGTVPEGTTVTETVKVVDQNGNPAAGLTVEFARSGSAGNESVVRTTNSAGEANYTFIASESGTINIIAVVRDGDQEKTLTDTVTVGGDNGTGGRVQIEAKLFGKNFNAKSDRLVVNAPRIAQGATVRLYKVVAGNKRIQVGNVKSLNNRGDAVFTVADRNRGRITRYVAVVAQTIKTLADTTNQRRVR